MSSSSHDATGTFWGEVLSRGRRRENFRSVPGLEKADGKWRADVKSQQKFLGCVFLLSQAKIILEAQGTLISMGAEYAPAESEFMVLCARCGQSSCKLRNMVPSYSLSPAVPCQTVRYQGQSWFCGEACLCNDPACRVHSRSP